MGSSGAMSGPGWMPTAPPSLAGLLAWHPQPIPLFPAGCLLAALLYAAGVRRLRRRGDAWPPGRTLVFTAGLGAVLEVTATGIGGYGMRLLSVHMVQHMVLSLVAPVLLLLGAPVTLALRALPPAARARRGPREYLVTALHSRPARAATSPLFTLPLFIASLYGLYFTSLFGVLMRTWWGHDVMLAHFLLVGLLFFYPLLGADPAPRRPHPVLGILELLAGMPFHAFFGIAVMMSASPIAPYFAQALPGAWPTSTLSDQRTAGAIAWAFAEIPTVLVLLVLAARWRRSDTRAAARADRAADRDHDADLAAYNQHLAALAGRADPAGP
jgi:cytochrome c oxidase assembly factor CtaG